LFEAAKTLGGLGFHENSQFLHFPIRVFYAPERAEQLISVNAHANFCFGLVTLLAGALGGYAE
jgi:hypothetical protein